MSDFSFAGLAQGAIEQFAADLHTCIPARIISLSHDLQKATVQPMVKARYTDADGNPEKGLKEMSSITSVPLIFPASRYAIMTFPVEVGDLVLLLFSERSIDAFKYSDGKNPIDPKDLRKHEYTDAIAICGMFTYPTALGIHPTDTVIRMNAGKSNETKISLKPNGDIVADSSAKFIVNAQSTVEVNASNAIVNCDTRINGDLLVMGDVAISGTSSANDHLSSGISGKNHTHSVPLVRAGTDTKPTTAPM